MKSRKDKKVWMAAAVACVMASGVGGASADRFIHIESDDLHDATAGTIEPIWEAPEEGDTSSLQCKQTSKSKKNSGLGNNCSFCLNEDGTALESCMCDGDNKNHDDCDLSIESGSGEWEAFSTQYSELIYQVLRANNIDPGAAGSGNLIGVNPGTGRRLSRQTWKRE